jgi:hypothetical protein
MLFQVLFTRVLWCASMLFVVRFHVGCGAHWECSGPLEGKALDIMSVPGSAVLWFISNIILDTISEIVRK